MMERENMGNLGSSLMKISQEVGLKYAREKSNIPHFKKLLLLLATQHILLFIPPFQPEENCLGLWMACIGFGPAVLFFEAD